MKKIIICILSLCLLCTIPLYAFAVSSYDYDEGAKILVFVPEKHEIKTHFHEGVMLYMDGNAVYPAEVDRLSEHTFTMDRFDDSGREIQSVFLNGEDITEQIFGEGYTVPSVHEDLEFSVVYADADATTAAAAETAPTDTEPAETTAVTTDTTPTETTTLAETSSEATAPADTEDNNPGTGVQVQAPFGIGVFFIASALGVYLLRKKE